MLSLLVGRSSCTCARYTTIPACVSDALTTATQALKHLWRIRALWHIYSTTCTYAVDALLHNTPPVSPINCIIQWYSVYT